MRTGAILGCAELVDCIRPTEILRFAPKPIRDKQALWFGKVSTRTKIPPHLEAVAEFLCGVDAESWWHIGFDPEGFCWILRQPQLLAESVPCKGRLNVWEHDWDQRFGQFRDA
jgi:hypothetical protein